MTTAPANAQNMAVTRKMLMTLIQAGPVVVSHFCNAFATFGQMRCLETFEKGSQSSRVGLHRVAHRLTTTGVNGAVNIRWGLSGTWKHRFFLRRGRLHRPSGLNREGDYQCTHSPVD